MNKKGLSGPIISVLLMIGVLGFIMIMYFFWGLLGPQISSSFNLITVQMQDASQSSGDQNIVDATDSTFTNINPGFQNMQWLSYSILVFLILGFIFLCFFVRTYPFLILFWIGGMLVIIFASIFLSNSYNAIASGPLASTYQSWGTNHFIMSNLPQIFSTVGFLGGFILFVIASRSSEAEGVAI